MKLDKMKFAKLVCLVTQFGFNGSDCELEAMDEIIDIDVQPVPSGQIDPAVLNRLLDLLKEGTQKIEAIKQYRLMTGYGLKDAKDAVEMYWNGSTYTKQH